MKDYIQLCIEELRHTVTAAGLNYEIWWVYKSPESRPQYVDVMNRYPLFFQTSIHAHFIAVLVGLYRLYETRGDTYNLPSLLRCTKDEKTLPEDIVDELDRIFTQKAKPLWVKVSILRNKAFGHRSAANTVEEIFEEAKVAPNDLRDLLQVTKEFLNMLSRALDKSQHEFNLSSREDTLALLSDLKKLNEG